MDSQLFLLSLRQETGGIRHFGPVVDRVEFADIPREPCPPGPADVEKPFTSISPLAGEAGGDHHSTSNAVSLVIGDRD